MPFLHNSVYDPVQTNVADIAGFTLDSYGVGGYPVIFSFFVFLVKLDVYLGFPLFIAFYQTFPGKTFQKKILVVFMNVFNIIVNQIVITSRVDYSIIEEALITNHCVGILCQVCHNMQDRDFGQIQADSV